MKHVKKFICLGILTLGSMFWHGCCTFESYFLPSYIDTYFFYDGIAVKRALASTSTKHLHLQCNLTNHVSFLSEGAEKELYEKLCRMCGDTAYNATERREIDRLNATNFPHFTTINVVSDKDFDAEHPAGTSLNDVMSIRYVSAQRFIESGYTAERSRHEEISKPLDELTSNELMYSIDNTFLVFDKEPDVLEKHTLTITCINAEGESYSVEYKYDFTLPEGLIKGETEVYTTYYNR